MSGWRWSTDGITCCLGVLVSCMSCTSLLGIDNVYVTSSTPPPASGGQGGSAIIDASIDTKDAVGGGGAGGEAGGAGGTIEVMEAGACEPGCTPTEKCCGGKCVKLSPATGCSPTECTPCASPPLHATAACISQECSFGCSGGYVKQGDACNPPATGGSPGAGGGVQCGGVTCPPCPNLGFPYVACCQPNVKCGCGLSSGNLGAGGLGASTCGPPPP